MNIGIIIERQRKKRFLGGFGRIKVKTLAHPRGFEAVIVELGVSAEKLEKLRRKRRKRFERILRRAERELIARYVKNVVLASSLKPVLRDYSFGCVSVSRGENEFYRFLPELIKKYKKQYKLGENARLGIRDRNVSRRTEFLVDALYREFKNISIYAENPRGDEAEELTERIFCETGLLLEISERPDIQRGAEADVFADLINNRLRVGKNLLIGSIVPDIDLLGCDINAMDLFAAAELKNCAVKSCRFC